MPAYRFLRWLLGAAMRVFFRQIEVVGLEHVPVRGPVIFAGNHPSSLIDPILIITSCGRVVHFAAKDTLFKRRLLRRVLRGLGAVPLQRRDDHGQHVTNDAAFTAMFDTLGEGGAIGIFPEGLSHDAAQLARLKTGAARLALGAAGLGMPVRIIPCGLTYIHPKRFRSRVLVQFGPPIVVDHSWVVRHDDAALGVARELTGELDTALHALTINAADWDTVRVLDTVRRLYQPLDVPIADRVELARRFNAHYPAVAGEPRVRAVFDRAVAYQARLDELGLTDRELARRLGPDDARRRVLHYLALVGLWLPLTLPGALLHLPALALARLAGRRLTPRKDVVATTKVLVGILFVGIAYLIAGALVWWRLGWAWALAGAVLLPVSGWATLRVLDGVHLLRRGVGVLRRSVHLADEARHLRAERQLLAADVVRLVDELRPPELEPLYPHGAEPA
jgi:glycerol-3-phosphate O-acyltransferase / dihydroxyacetone phosphate acyltransferase